MAADSSDETWLQEEFRSSEARFKTNFEAIIAKYNKPFKESDELDLTTMRVVRDRGHLRRGKNHVFGHSKLAVSKRRDMSYFQTSGNSTIWGKADETHVSMMHSKLPHILINDDISDAETISSESSSSGDESDSEHEDTDEKVYSSQDSPLCESPTKKEKALPLKISLESPELPTDSKKAKITKRLKPWTFTKIKQEKKFDSHEYENPLDDQRGKCFLPQEQKLDFNQNFEKDYRKSNIFSNAIPLTPERTSMKNSGYITLTPENDSFRTLLKPPVSSDYTPVKQLHSPSGHLQKIQSKMSLVVPKRYSNQVQSHEQENDSGHISQSLTMSLDTEPISGSPNFTLTPRKGIDHYRESTKLEIIKSDLYHDKGDSGFETWSSIGQSSSISSCVTPKSSKPHLTSSSTGKKLRISSTRAKQLISVPRYSNEDIIKILTSPEPAVKPSIALNPSPGLRAGEVSTPTRLQERKAITLRQADMITDSSRYSAPPKLVRSLSMKNGNAKKMWRSSKLLKLLQNTSQDYMQEAKENSGLEKEYLMKDSAIGTEKRKEGESKKTFMDATYLIRERQQKFESNNSLKGIGQVPSASEMKDQGQNKCANKRMLLASQSSDSNMTENNSKETDYSETWNKDMNSRSPAYIFTKLKARATLEKLDRQHSKDMKSKKPEREEISLEKIRSSDVKQFSQEAEPKSITFAEFLQRNQENTAAKQKDANPQMEVNVRHAVNLNYKASDARIPPLVRPVSLAPVNQESSRRATKYADKHITEQVHVHSNNFQKQSTMHEIPLKNNCFVPKIEEKQMVKMPITSERKDSRITTPKKKDPIQTRITSTPGKKSAKIFDISSISMIEPSKPPHLEGHSTFRQKQTVARRGCLFEGSDEECTVKGSDEKYEEVIFLDSPEYKNTKKISREKDCINREESAISSFDKHLLCEKVKTEQWNMEKRSLNHDRSNQHKCCELGRQTIKYRKTDNELGCGIQKDRLMDVYDIDHCTDFYITNSTAIQNAKGYNSVYAREKKCARKPGDSTDSSVDSLYSSDSMQANQSRYMRAKRRDISSKVNSKCNVSGSPIKNEKSREKHKKDNMFVVDKDTIFVQKKQQVHKSDQMTFSKKTVLSHYEINSTIKSSKRNRFTSSSEEDTPKRRCFLNSSKHVNSVKNTPPKLVRSANKSVLSPSQCKGQNVCTKSFCFECN